MAAVSTNLLEWLSHPNAHRFNPRTPGLCCRSCTSSIASIFLDRAHTNTYRVGEDIVVRLKWGETEYKGRLVSVDSYMNIQLSECEEYIDGTNKGTLGQVLIRYVPKAGRNQWILQQVLAEEFADLFPYRCNNVLWISAARSGQNGDVKMEG